MRFILFHIPFTNKNHSHSTLNESNLYGHSQTIKISRGFCGHLRSVPSVCTQIRAALVGKMVIPFVET